MRFIKCRSEREKLYYIKYYCEEQIAECIRIINMFEADKTSVLDYAEEIHECNMRKARFEKIVQIIDADEFTSVML